MPPIFTSLGIRWDLFKESAYEQVNISSQELLTDIENVSLKALHLLFLN